MANLDTRGHVVSNMTAKCPKRSKFHGKFTRRPRILPLPTGYAVFTAQMTTSRLVGWGKFLFTFFLGGWGAQV